MNVEGLSGMFKRIVNITALAGLILALAGSAPAAIITSNNTGSTQPITILDWDGSGSDAGVSNSSGSGGTDSDSNDRVYGSLGRWAVSTESTTYSFTGLAQGDYRIFTTWLHDNVRSDANGSIDANGSFVGTFNGINTATDIGGIDISQGFIAQKTVAVDPNGSPFEYVGVGTVGPADNNTLTVVITSSGDNFRSDAVGIQSIPVPEPATMTLLAMGGFGALARRRKRA